jgi:biotin carboxyl carrier protein
VNDSEILQRTPDGPARSDAAAGGVTLLEQGLWRRLTTATSAEEMSASWGALMFDMLDEAEVCCVFLLDPESGRLRTVANWPEARIPGGALLSAAEAAVEANRGVVRGAIETAGHADGKLMSVASPLAVDGQVLGAIGVELIPSSQASLRAVMRQLQWGGAWLRDALRTEEAIRKSAQYDHAVHALHSVVGVAEQEDFATAGRAAATDLANRFQCDRVSIGFLRFGRTRVCAISHSAQFSKRMSLVSMLGAAMDEAIDQRGVVVFPAAAADEPMAAHRHERLARDHKVSNILTVPLYSVDRFVGAVTFERPEGRGFSQVEVDVLEAVTTVLAPVLDEKRRNDRWLVVKAVEVVFNHFTRLVGPGKLMRKAVVVSALALGAFFWVATGEDRIAADAVVEGRIQRTIAAPFDGFIAETFARAGDLVAKDQLLIRLDDREMALERLRLGTEGQRQQIEYDRALASGDRAETSIRRNQIEQIQAQIELIDKQMERTRLTAPFAGLVVAGDLTQDIGSSVARGDGLLTIAPAGEFRITLRVDERRIADIEPGQVGQLLVTALPDRTFPMVVRKITPVAEYLEGATTFRVEAALETDAPGLQPGMEGVGKIDVAEAKLIAIWTRPMRDWVRIKSWLWLGWQ